MIIPFLLPVKRIMIFLVPSVAPFAYRIISMDYNRLVFIPMLYSVVLCVSGYVDIQWLVNMRQLDLRA